MVVIINLAMKTGLNIDSKKTLNPQALTVNRQRSTVNP
jgi:hypothetical protein